MTHVIPVQVQCFTDCGITEAYCHKELFDYEFVILSQAASKLK